MSAAAQQPPKTATDLALKSSETQVVPWAPGDLALELMIKGQRPPSEDQMLQSELLWSPGSPAWKRWLKAVKSNKEGGPITTEAAAAAASA